MGAELVAGIIAGAGALGAAGVSAYSASANNRAMQAYGMEQSEEGRRFAEQMYALQFRHGIEAEERADQRYYQQAQFQSEQQKELLSWLNKEFNSPSAQAAALRKAGINPSVIFGSQSPFGNQSLPGAAGPTGMVGSVPGSSLPGISGTPNLQNVGLALGSGIEQVSGALSNVAKANLDAQQKNNLSATLEHQVRNMILQNNGLETANSHANLLLQIDKTFKSKTVAQELKNLINEGVRLHYAGKNEEANNALLKLQEKLLSFQNEKNEAEIPYLQQNAQAFADGLQLGNQVREEQVKTEQSQQVSNYASASASYALAKVHRIQSELSTMDLAKAKQTFNAELLSALDQLEADSAASQETIKEAQKRISELNRYDSMPGFLKATAQFTEWLSGNVGNIIGAAAGAYVGAKTGRPRASSVANERNHLKKILGK